MDPNEALRLIRTWAVTASLDPENDIAYEAAVAFEGLDDWLSSGGFLPGDWQRTDDNGKG